MNYKKLGNRQDLPFDPVQSLARRRSIVDEITAIHCEMPAILGVFLSGTRAGVPRDQFSDLDFVVVCQDDGPSPASIGEIRQRLGVPDRYVRTFFDISDEYGVSSAFDLNGIETCLIYYKEIYLEDAVSRFFAGEFKKVGAFYPGALVAALAENPILFSRGNALHALKTQASSFPEEAKRRICIQETGWFDYYLEKTEQYLFRNDQNGLQLTYAHSVDSILNIIFSLNDIPYSGPGKAFEAKIDRLQISPPFLRESIFTIHTGLDAFGRQAGNEARLSHLTRLIEDTRALVRQLIEPNLSALAGNAF